MSQSAPLDTSSQEWLLICLARHICRMPTRQHRRDFLDLFGKKRNPEFMANLESIIKEQWVMLYPPTTSKAQHGNA